jgi:hypothetical protein
LRKEREKRKHRRERDGSLVAAKKGSEGRWMVYQGNDSLVAVKKGGEGR